MKIIIKKVVEIIITLGIILLVRLVLCNIFNTEIFTKSFLLFIVVFSFTAIIYKFVFKRTKN